MIDLVFYLLVFVAVGVFFLFIHLMIGKIIRPHRPDPEKMTIYECGEPTVGSAWVQFDLRYYVVALLFVVFDVEVAFFFPWAVVFGKANELAQLPEKHDRRSQLTRDLVPSELNNLVYFEKQPKQTNQFARANDEATNKGGKAKIERNDSNKKAAAVADPEKPGSEKAPGRGKMMSPVAGSTQAAAPEVKLPVVEDIDAATARTWAWIAFGDILVFFGVLMVGFAYLWKRGDINWVRSTAAEQ
ncbi:MAG: NADH-quinone oxidoreductase subunit A [Gemmataceae bacterium]|nr:NADH-quinone oxidoreductase subunit A [Gemmataceae bacterium]